MARVLPVIEQIVQGHPERTVFSRFITPVDAREFSLDLEPPLPAATPRYAQAYLRRVRPALEGQLTDDDLSALDMLLADGGPHSILERGDLLVTGSRSGWLVRKG